MLENVDPSPRPGRYQEAAKIGHRHQDALTLLKHTGDVLSDLESVENATDRWRTRCPRMQADLQPKTR